MIKYSITLTPLLSILRVARFRQQSLNSRIIISRIPEILVLHLPLGRKTIALDATGKNAEIGTMVQSPPKDFVAIQYFIFCVIRNQKVVSLQ